MPCRQKNLCSSDTATWKRYDSACCVTGGARHFEMRLREVLQGPMKAPGERHECPSLALGWVTRFGAAEIGGSVTGAEGGGASPRVAGARR